MIVYRTRDLLASTLEIGLGTPYLFTQIYSLSIDVSPGDVVDVSGFFQASTLFEHSVMVGRYVVGHPGAAFEPGLHGGAYLVRPHTQNIRSSHRHNPMWVAGVEEVEVEATRHYSLVGYAASVNAEPTDSLTIDNYGELAARVWRAA